MFDEMTENEIKQLATFAARVLTSSARDVDTDAIVTRFKAQLDDAFYVALKGADEVSDETDDADDIAFQAIVEANDTTKKK